MNSPLGIGVIGVGFGQQVHIPALAADSRCRVVGLCASTGERAARVAKQLGIAKSFGDWREMIADPAIDAVSIATPPGVQASIVQAAARAGKHVFCEKPIASNLAEARAMLAAAAGVVHAVDFMFPEIPQWRQAKEALDGNLLRKIRHVSVAWRVETYAYRNKIQSWKIRPDDGGGVLNSFISHSFYYLEWLVGPIGKLMARAAGTAESSVDLWAESAGGFPISISAAADAFGGCGHRVEIYGEAGSLKLENITPDYCRGFTLQCATRENRPFAQAAAGETGAGDGRIAPVAAIAGRFIDAIISGGRVRPNLADGVRVQLLLDAARKSFASGEWQEITPPMNPELDIVIPVYNEGENIIAVLESIHRQVKTPCRILICYDSDQDNTLPAIRARPIADLEIVPVLNRGKGALGAVLSGFEASVAPAVLVFAADDDYNAGRIDEMVARFREGCDIVVASRFIPGGCMKDCPWLKALLVRCSAFALYHLARLPTHDASNGFRLFSRRALQSIPIESTKSFAYSIELLVKAHRLGWKIGEVPVGWFERRHGASRFRVIQWIPQYLVWFGYAFATTYLFRGPNTVRLRSGEHGKNEGN